MCVFRLKEIKEEKRVLYGVRAASRHFLENDWTHKKVANEIMWHARLNNFDGVFLDFEAAMVLSPHFQHFLDTLRERMREIDTPYVDLPRLTLVLGIQVRSISKIKSKTEFNFLGATRPTTGEAIGQNRVLFYSLLFVVE